MRKTVFQLTAAALTVTAASTMSLAQSSVLMVTGSHESPTWRGIATFDAETGALIDSHRIDATDLASGIFKHAIQVGDEIWISTQAAARILRFSAEGGYIGDISEAMPGQPLNNLRGLALIGDTVYLTNAGTFGGAPGPALVTYDMEGNWLATYPTADTSPFDVVEYGDELLVSHQGTADIQRYTAGGSHLGPFHVGAISWVQQLHITSAGNVLATGWSSNGLYEYDSAGNLISVVAADSPRGIWELGNGNILWTNSSGVHIYDVIGQSHSTALPGFNAQYIDLLSFDDPAPKCPGDLTGNGNVGVPDLLALLACWGPVAPGCEAADLTGNDNVGVPDLLALLANWGPCPE